MPTRDCPASAGSRTRPSTTPAHTGAAVAVAPAAGPRRRGAASGQAGKPCRPRCRMPPGAFRHENPPIRGGVCWWPRCPWRSGFNDPGSSHARSRAVAWIGRRQLGKTSLARRFLPESPPRRFDSEYELDRQRPEEPLTVLGALSAPDRARRDPAPAGSDPVQRAGHGGGRSVVRGRSFGDAGVSATNVRECSAGRRCKKPASRRPWTKTLRVYDVRTNGRFLQATNAQALGPESTRSPVRNGEPAWPEGDSD